VHGVWHVCFRVGLKHPAHTSNMVALAWACLNVLLLLLGCRHLGGVQRLDASARSDGLVAAHRVLTEVSANHGYAEGVC
jgi:hypothetical protein